MRDIATQREDMDKIRDLKTRLRENHTTGMNVTDDPTLSTIPHASRSPTQQEDSRNTSPPLRTAGAPTPPDPSHGDQP